MRAVRPWVCLVGWQLVVVFVGPCTAEMFVGCLFLPWVVHLAQARIPSFMSPFPYDSNPSSRRVGCTARHEPCTCNLQWAKAMLYLLRMNLNSKESYQWYWSHVLLFRGWGYLTFPAYIRFHFRSPAPWSHASNLLSEILLGDLGWVKWKMLRDPRITVSNNNQMTLNTNDPPYKYLYHWVLLRRQTSLRKGLRSFLNLKCPNPRHQ